MESADFRRRITLAWQFVYNKLSIGRTFSSPHPLRVNSLYNETALNPSSTYKDIYLKSISLSHYNFMLNDHAVFHFIWQGTDNWGLVYLPNPWISGVHDANERLDQWESLQELGGLDDEDLIHLERDLVTLKRILHV
jgi:hypothetical protein